MVSSFSSSLICLARWFTAMDGVGFKRTRVIAMVMRQHDMLDLANVRARTTRIPFPDLTLWTGVEEKNMLFVSFCCDLWLC